MPGWNIHLEAGERVAKKLKLSGAKRKEFLLGCLLPDINNGYINKVKVEKPHEKTHYAFDQKSSLNFYAENKDKIDARDPLFLGCLLHLYTDGYFNYDFYRTIKHSPIGEGLEREAKRKIKHHDFWIYDTNFNHRLGVTNRAEAKNLSVAANAVNAIEIVPEDIEDVERILTNQSLSSSAKDQEYIFYTKDRLDQLLDDMIESFSHDYLEEKHA